ncbi:hypothetical protein ACIBF6_20300 [Streptosporangium amethystogenes]|uniref:hypothetical protein n=1 Tax=Streptosporangium amethystogenes TaxID=2002 RepID=UPI0037AEDF70
MSNSKDFSPNPAGLSRAWSFTEEMVIEAATASKHCEKIPHGRHILHVFASMPSRSYRLDQLAREMETTEADVLEAIRRIDRLCDAYGREPLVKKAGEDYKMEKETANVLMAAWESWT